MSALHFSLRHLLITFFFISVYATVLKVYPAFGVAAASLTLMILAEVFGHSANNIFVKLLLLVIVGVCLFAFVFSLCIVFDDFFTKW